MTEYRVADYLWMIADEPRVAAYAKALRAQLAPGARVVDIGAGFGFFSVIAAKAGAGHVDAVETNPVVHLGPKFAAANGCADRIRFHHSDAGLVTLDEPADLLIADLRGPTPFGPRALDTLIHARRRLLRDRGIMIARSDTLFVAPTRAPAGVRREIHAARGQEDLDLGPVERIVYDTPMRFSIAADDLLDSGQPWLTIDYRTVTATDFTGEASWDWQREATVEGLAVWFEADLGAGFTFSSAPGSDIAAYRQMFIPLREALAVRPGDQLRVALKVRNLRDNCIWEWQLSLRERGSTAVRLACDQNSIAEMIVDPAAFVLTSDTATPTIGARSRALRDLLGWMDGQQTVATLATRLWQAAPELFSDVGAAKEFVAEWTQSAQRLDRGLP